MCVIILCIPTLTGQRSYCTRVFEQVNLRVCFVHSLSPGLCFSCHVSPISHGLYLARRSQPNSMGGASERRELGRRSAWWLRCAVSKITRTKPAVMFNGGRGGRRGAETTNQSSPNTMHEITDTWKHSYHSWQLFSIHLSDLKCHKTIPKVVHNTPNGWLIWK